MLLIGAANLAGRDPGSLAHLWDATNCQPLVAPLPHLFGVWSVAISPDGKKLLTADGTGAQLWDRATHRVEKKFSGSNKGVFYPDGTRLLLVSGGFGQVWDIATGKLLGPPRFHTEGGIKGLAFSPDSRGILIVGSDKAARLWDVTTGKLLGPPVGQVEVYSVAISPNGHLLAAGSLDGRSAVWQAPRPLPGSVERIRLWIEVLTGMELDSREVIQELSPAALRERRQRLEALGGPPALPPKEEHRH